MITTLSVGRADMEAPILTDAGVSVGGCVIIGRPAPTVRASSRPRSGCCNSLHRSHGVARGYADGAARCGPTASDGQTARVPAEQASSVARPHTADQSHAYAAGR